jgi:hypothetical protein
MRSQDARQRLATAVSALRTGERQHDELAQAQTRATTELREAATALHAEIDTLERLRREQPKVLAYEFIHSHLLTRNQSLAEAEAAMQRRQHEHDHLTEVESALNSEIDQSHRRLRNLHRDLVVAVADVLCGSPEIEGLLIALEKRWAEIRGIRRCFDMISRRLPGGMPSSMLSRWQVAPSLDPAAINVDTDNSFADEWAAALDALFGGAYDTPLPGRPL